MKKARKAQTFRQQMARSMAELESIMLRRQSPTGDGRFAVRTIKVTERALRRSRLERRDRAIYD